MEIRGLIWYTDIIDKLETKHGVQQAEVRDILQSSPKFRFVEKGHHPGENLYSASGQSESSRFLIVFFVYKHDKRALILSARDMNDKERKIYAKK